LEKRKSLFHAEIRNPDRPAHSLVATPTFVDVTERKISVFLAVSQAAQSP
jgi:hypothetical protein